MGLRRPTAGTDLGWHQKPRRTGQGRLVARVDVWSLVGSEQVVVGQRSIADRDLASGDAWLGLRAQHHEASPVRPHQRSIVLHQTVASLHVAGATERTMNVNFSERSVSFDARDGDDTRVRHQTLPGATQRGRVRTRRAQTPVEAHRPGQRTHQRVRERAPASVASQGSGGGQSGIKEGGFDLALGG